MSTPKYDKADELLLFQMIAEKKRQEDDARIRSLPFGEFMYEIKKVVAFTLAGQQLGYGSTPEELESFERRVTDLYQNDHIFYQRVSALFAMLQQLLYARYDR